MKIKMDLVSRTDLVIKNRAQSDTCFWTGSGQNDPIYPYFFRKGDGYQ